VRTEFIEYLPPVAGVHAQVDAAAAAICVRAAPIPDFDEYASDFHAGVPLLHSWKLTVNLLPPQADVLALIRTLASSSLPGTFAEQCRALEAEIDSIGAKNELPLAHIGLFRYLGWAVLARYLAPVVSAFDAWRDEERWLRNYCPTCGEPPALAQLVGKGHGGLPKLACVRCKTRWRSLHLDITARERGLKRMAAALSPLGT
jgi:FdhE protein